MSRKSSTLLSDGAFLLLFLACFISIVFVARDPDTYLMNIVYLNVAFLIAIITYFSSILTGLILNVLFLFGYGTYSLYETVVQGGTIGLQNYFWLLMTPVFTVVTWLFTLASRRLQEENDELAKRNASIATLDEHTNLKNSLSFQKDATVFIALSVRYKIPLTLLVIGVKYWDELKRMIREEQVTETVRNITEVGQSSIRTNDSLYMLDNEKLTWGLLLFTDREGANIVIDRLKAKMAENREELIVRSRYKIDLKIGAIEFDAERTPTPLDMIALARKELEYDV